MHNRVYCVSGCVNATRALTTTRRAESEAGNEIDSRVHAAVMSLSPLKLSLPHPVVCQVQIMQTHTLLATKHLKRTHSRANCFWRWMCGKHTWLSISIMLRVCEWRWTPFSFIIKHTHGSGFFCEGKVPCVVRRRIIGLFSTQTNFAFFPFSDNLYSQKF